MREIADPFRNIAKTAGCMIKFKLTFLFQFFSVTLEELFKQDIVSKLILRLPIRNPHFLELLKTFYKAYSSIYYFFNFVSFAHMRYII